MAHFIDRRLNGKNKSAVNRQRFIRRYKEQIKKAVSDAVTRRSIQDIEQGESVSIPSRDISEPVFHQGKGGHRELVHPGNDRFVTGDNLDRPQGGAGQGAGQGDASNQGDGEDDFVFDISKDEYLDLLFDDLELPNLQPNDVSQLVEMKTHRAGFTAHGVPANINIVRSLQNSLARRIALQAGKKRQLKALEADYHAALARGADAEHLHQLQQQIATLRQRIAAVPFIDTFDLRYNHFVKRPEPSSQAVMFCLMDVSGSMDQATKKMAKRFYILLYLFLTRSYRNVEVVFIRHHTQAKEVNEHDFFYSQETGGTIVSSALQLMAEIQQARYPAAQWNIYAAQASDGDNWADDSPQCSKLLAEQILPFVRYYAYIEITSRAHQSLWYQYEQLAQRWPHFAMENIRRVEDIYPVFRELFRKQRPQGAHL